ncbi:hypothetical protein BGZ47_009578 [Haplosporangium gracile]|nr:hypothetical protein BGZ47_009578 [Haplosporangium gracile]
MEPSLPIPSYPFPCLAHSTTATPLSTTPPTTTIYLIGVATESPQKEKGRLELNSVFLTDINTPIIQLIESEVDPEHWSSFAPKLCAHYTGTIYPNEKGEIKPTRIHIQQFSKHWSFDSNALLDEEDEKGGNGGEGDSNGKATFENPKNWDRGASFLSPRQFAIVGQAGERMYGVGMTSSLDLQVGSSWRGLIVDATADVDSYLYSSVAPVLGHITAFEVSGTSGQIFPAFSMEEFVQLKQPQPVQMNNITLSPVAIPVHMGTTAFILDQDKDGSVVIYTITPELSPDLTLIQASPSSLVPRFSEYMVASATATASQIVVYSVQNGVPCFNSFDLTAKSWSGPALVTQSQPILPTTTPSDGSSGGHEGDSGIGSENSTSGKSNGAIIGGAVAGGLILIILAALFIVQRKRRCNRGSHSRKCVLTKGEKPSILGPEGGEENMPALSDYQQDLSAPPSYLFESSGSFATLSSSTTPLTYIPPQSTFAPSGPPVVNQRPSVRPLSIPPRPQQQQLSQVQAQAQQRQQAPRRGFSVQEIEVISFPSIHEKHRYEQEQEQQRQQREQERQQRLHLSQLYSTGHSFSDSNIYQAHPIRTNTAITHRGANNQSTSNSGSAREEEPYTLPAPFVVAPTPQPHKAELLE